MKHKILILLFVIFSVFLCGCSGTDSVSRESVTVNMPSDNTVNGYRVKYKSEETVSSPQSTVSDKQTSESKTIQYCANTSSKKFHLPDCSSVKSTKDENKLFLSDRDQLIELGYEPCKRCNP